MIRTIYCVITFGIILILGCGNEAKKNMLPELKDCDSAAVMYYKTPGNPRFFNMAKIYSKDSLITLAENANTKLINEKPDCVTQGKIYFYRGKEEVYILYFSRTSECMTLSFIKTGEKYFVRMNSGTASTLTDLEKTAREPVSIE